MAITYSRLALAGILLGGALQWSAEAFAGENGGAVPETAGSLFGQAALDGGALDEYRGGSEVLMYEINKSDGIVSDNQAYNLTTGNNLITEGSLAGASGFSTVIQNSGNNVLIQNSTIINLDVR